MIQSNRPLIAARKSWSHPSVLLVGAIVLRPGSVLLLFLAFLPAGCVTDQGRISDRTRSTLRHAGNAIHLYRDRERSFPKESVVWSLLWSRILIPNQSPYFKIIHDPHGMLVFDYWDRPLQYKVSKGVVILTSSGPNGKFGDPDDLVERIPP